MKLEIVASIIGAILALIGSLVTAQLALLRRKKLDKRRLEVMRLYEETYARLLNNYSNNYPKIDIDDLWHALSEESASASASAVVTLPTVSTEEIKREVNRHVESLKERIEGIEKRFPEQSTVDKIASVNEAILATKIENLTESIKKLGEKLLTRWDVAKIVFQIIAALSGLIGVVFTVISYLNK